MELTRHNSYRNHVLSVICGVLVGALLMFGTSKDGCSDNYSTIMAGETTDSGVELPSRFSVRKEAVERLMESESEIKEIKQMLVKLKDTKNYHQKELEGQIVDTELADKLKDEVRILCWVLTVPEYHLVKAIHVKNTWLSRCNEFLIMSTTKDSGIGTVALNVTEDPYHNWGKLKAAYKYIHRFHMENIDWVLKVEDDTYVVVENLRHMLYSYSPKDLIHFGYKKQSDEIRQGYMDKGAFVMSKAAVEKLVTEGLTNATKCRADEEGSEEIELGKCLENLEVYAGDSRDAKGKGRFFTRDPEDQLLPEEPLDPYRYYPDEGGPDSLSEYTIAFTNVYVDRFYAFDYLLYHLRPYGIIHYNEPLPKKVNFKEVIEKLNSDRPIPVVLPTTTSTTTTSSSVSMASVEIVSETKGERTTSTQATESISSSSQNTTLSSSTAAETT